MATGRSCSATTGPQNTCLQEGSGLGLSHGLCVALATLADRSRCRGLLLSLEKAMFL